MQDCLRNQTLNLPAKVRTTTIIESVKHVFNTMIFINDLCSYFIAPQLNYFFIIDLIILWQQAFHHIQQFAFLAAQKPLQEQAL